MQKWEYFVIQRTFENNPQVSFINNERQVGKPLYPYLQEMGEQGWELVSVNNALLYFKRPIE